MSADLAAAAPDRTIDPALRTARRRISLLAVLAVTSIVAYLATDVGGSWTFALRLRSTSVVTMVLVGYAVAVSTVLSGRSRTIASSRRRSWGPTRCTRRCNRCWWPGSAR
jgi:hypothetical protein